MKRLLLNFCWAVAFYTISNCCFTMLNLDKNFKKRLRQVLFAKRVPVKQEVKPPIAVWLEQTVR